MSDISTRSTERGAAERDPEMEMDLFIKRSREGAGDSELSALLRGLKESIHADVDDILEQSPLSQERQAILKLVMKMEEQISFAQKNAIQPREGDTPLPDREAIMASILKILTPEQAQEILTFKEPRLVLIPITSAERYREELNNARQIMTGSRDTYFTQYSEDLLGEQAMVAQVEDNQIKKWQFSITEGAQTFDTPEWDNIQETLERRLELFNERFKKIQMTRLGYQAYIALMIQGLREGRPTDCEYIGNSTDSFALTKKQQYTLVEEVDEGVIGAAYWRSHYRNVMVILNGFDSNRKYNDSQFRPAVTKDIEREV